MLRAAVAAEAAGVPSVSLVTEGFVRQALATGRGLGFDGMRLAVLAGHVDSQSYDEMVASFVATGIDQVVEALTRPVEHDPLATREPDALEVVVCGTLDDVTEHFVANGWTDGLPIVPPTRDAVEAFIAPSGHDPWRVLGQARPSGRDVTVWSVAVNGVMAGCRPEHLPVLLAIAEVLVDPHYGVEHSGNTTGADALIVLHGPNAAQLGFHSGQGALREGARANTAVGRWLRLYLRNVCGFTADEHDKATFGNSTRVVLTEDHDALARLGWPPLASDFGFGADDDVVTVGRINSGMILGSVFGSTPDEVLDYLADGLTRVTGWDLTHVFGLGRGQYRPLLVLSPMVAGVFARAGWTRDDVRRALFERALIPARKFESLIGAWTNLTAGRRTLVDLVAAGEVPPIFATSDDPERLVPIVTDWSCLLLAVAGDAGRANAYVMSNDGPHGEWTARPVDLTCSTDLACRIDRPDLCS